MNLYNPNKTPVTIAGKTYYPDSQGFCEIPDNVAPAAKQKGWVDAAAFMAKAPDPTPAPVPTPTPAKTETPAKEVKAPAAPK